MLQNDSNKKRITIMKNMQKLRNEIEEIRIQNLVLLENLKPYEGWYDETKKMLSSCKTRRPKINKSNKTSHYFSVSSSSSMSSESSDTEANSQAYENKKSSDNENDDFFSDEEYVQKKSTTTVKKKPKSNKSQTPIPQPPFLLNQLFNQNGNSKSYPLNKEKNSNNQAQLILEKPNMTSKKSISPINSSNSIKNKFDLVIDPPPIFPGINISYQKVSDSDEDQPDDKNKEQISCKSILTPIVKIKIA